MITSVIPIVKILFPMAGRIKVGVASWPGNSPGTTSCTDIPQGTLSTGTLQGLPLLQAFIRLTLIQAFLQGLPLVQASLQGLPLVQAFLMRLRENWMRLEQS